MFLLDGIGSSTEDTSRKGRYPMRNILIILSLIGIVVLSVLGGVDPAVPSSLKTGDVESNHPETPHFPD